MAKLLTLNTGYNPVSKFDNETIRMTGNMLYEGISSMIETLEEKGMPNADIEEFFTLSFKEVFSIHREKKEASKPKTKYQLGELIYYRGDMANHECWYKITGVSLPNKYSPMQYKLKEVGGEGRTTTIWESAISEVDNMNGSTRFVTEKAYNEARQAAQKRIEEAAAKRRIERDMNFTVEDMGTGLKLKNQYCIIEYNIKSQSFSGGDLTDHYNEPRFYNTTKRSHKKAAAALSKQFNGKTTMHEAMKIIQGAGVNCRSYCAMD